MIIFQKVVANDAKYNFSNPANMTVYDAHNDSPYNMGISFGRDTGIQQADYYTSPHSVLYGIGPLGNAQRSVGGAKWNGTVYIYTQTPLGGGPSNLSSVPASQITVIGYPTGYNPTGTTSLNRWNNIGNPVSTVGGIATSVQNDGNPPGTSVLESTPLGSPNTMASISADGTGFMANPWHFTNSVTVDGQITANQINAEAGNDFGVTVPAGQKIVNSVIGTGPVWDIKSTGPVLLAGSLSFLVGSISRVSMFSGTATTVVTAFNHNLGVAPDMILLTLTGTNTSLSMVKYDPASLTSTQVNVISDSSRSFVGLAIKF